MPAYAYPLTLPRYVHPRWNAFEQLIALADSRLHHEWGSERQIEAHNAWAAVAERLDPQTFGEESDYVAWCLKATEEEMVKEGMRLVDGIAGPEGKRELLMWRLRQNLLTVADAQQLLDEERALPSQGKIPTPDFIEWLESFIQEGRA